MISHRSIGDKCYGSTSSSNLEGVGSTPTSLAMTVRLENIPVFVSANDLTSASHQDLVEDKQFDMTPDMEFIVYLRENNPELLKVIKPFIKLARKNREYKLMMAAVMQVVKTIDIQLDANKIKDLIG